MFGAVAGTVEVDGLKLATLTWGPAEAPPILCLHGWLDNAASFAPLSAELPGYRLIAVDMPGHGASEHRPPGAAYHQLDWVINVSAILDRLSLRNTGLMGHSMGAGIAALTTGTYPEQIARLVLLEGVGPRPTRPDEIPEALREHCEIKKREAARRVIRKGAPFDTAVRARLAFGDGLSREAARLLCERGVEEAPGGVQFRVDRRLQQAQPLQLTEDQILAFLRRIACPTMLVLGSEGMRFREEVMAGRKAALRDLQEVELPGGHHVHMDTAPAVAAHLRPFLAGL